jgi:hypothetical protein
VSWTAEAAWAVPAAIVVVVLGTALTLATQLAIPAIVAIGTALALVHFRRIEVTVDEAHLRTAFGWPGWIRVSVPLAEITELEYVPDLRPVRYGGWGYRGSLRLLRKAAVIVRRGDGVIFALTGNRRFIVTVDDAGSLAEAVAARIRA